MATKTTETKTRRKPMPEEVKEFFTKMGQEGAKYGKEGAKFGKEGAAYGKEGAKYGAEGGQITANLVEMGRKYAEENDIDVAEWDKHAEEHHRTAKKH